MEHSLEQTLALLQRTPAAVDGLLRGLPEAWTSRHEGEKSWSAFEIVGHLIDTERTNWIPRARFLLEHGEYRAFEPFDRGGLVRETKGK